MSFILTLTLLNQAVAQSRTVSGTVTDQSTSLGLPGVAVIVKGTSVGTATTADGSYTLNVPEGAQTLVFRFIGYTTVEKAIGSATTINATLAVDSKQLEEVVVVGYGTQLKKDVTSSISKVKGAEIANLATPSFDQQLAGRASGVVVQQPSGILGAPPVIRIRGTNSISGSNSPLVVIDGVPALSGNTGVYASSNALGDINPNDIESFEILKDGAATAIYGSRASNGVILVTTKKGKKGQVKVNYDMYTGWSKAVKLHDLLNAEQFVEIANEKYTNAGNAPQAFMDKNNTNTNWNDYVYRTGFQQNHSISASAGTDRSKYYFSLGYTDQQGIAIANDLKRYSLRANLDQKVSERITFGVNIGLTHQLNNGVSTGSNSLGGNTFAVIRMLPNVAVYDAADETGYNIDDKNLAALGRGANLIHINNNTPNIVFSLKENIRRAASYRANGNTFLDFKIIEGLNLRTSLGVDLALSEDYGYMDPRHGDGRGLNGYIDQYYSPYSTWNWQNILSYNKSFNDMHNIDVTAVAEYNKTKSTYFNAFGSGISDRLFKENIVSGTLANKDISGGIGESGLSSYLGRINYNYKGKYYIGGSLRADGLSKLSPNNRWGYFPGVSAAWRVSEEDFFKGSAIANIVSDLRFRGSYAEVGNSSIVGGNFPYLGSFAPRPYGGASGISYSNTGNDELSWETQKISDVGIDLGFFNGRLNFEAAYWRKDNKDVVLAAPQPPSLGLPGNLIYMNIGSMKNDGLEFSVNGSIIEKSNFTWNANLNFSTQNNEVTALVNNQDIIGDYTINRVGESFNAIYGYVYEGVNKANGNPIYRKADGSLVQSSLQTGLSGYYVYDPANPNNLAFTTPAEKAEVQKLSRTLTNDDKVVLGSALPKWFGGLDNNFKYGNFDLNVFLRYSGGNKIMNRTRQDLLNQTFENNGTEILGRWQSPEKPGDGVTPRLYQGRGVAANADGQSTTRFVEDGDFLKVSNLALGYTLPSALTDRVKIQRLRVYAQMQNAFTITGYKGLDPEIFTSTGVDFNANPQQRVVLVGLNLGF
ncbi:TonB-dependent receptor [Pontibacter sp. BT310]|uniref:TonB-dependent receptor n=2 Tax=Pontibacter populi TaxID=890055 RepID=A0ABS6X761_9BACT|nr:TonB-dependent receptor [Pontibacter sp. BT310]MBJ6116979.1 TonB-dependent receptor [Pontibacter sp. BT310]MBR0569403.1 TonB-dependent receptor [Microvirga sp. STS03]MBW3363832.1 TonB-dependent receptor [Pontibacter populi]